jgi:hypothetical protein
LSYAFDEFQTLASGLDERASTKDPIVRYLCALVAELAYHHVPEFEFENSKRAKAVPCESYQAIIRSGVATDVVMFLREREFPEAFVIVDRGVVVVGIIWNKKLFLGFRGSQFLFDWKINLRAATTDTALNFSQKFAQMLWDCYGAYGGLHSGFLEEAVRVLSRIDDTIEPRLSAGDFRQVFLAGHSLGGAVAATTEILAPLYQTSTVLFGAPRYATASAYAIARRHRPTQIERRGDIVPTLPPTWMGYADHPNQFDTKGNEIFVPASSRCWWRWIWPYTLFAAKFFKPHSMEKYREELGVTAGVSLCRERLVPYEKIKRSDITV